MPTSGGRSAFEQFGAHLEEVDRRCPFCGHVGDAEWTVVAVEGDVAYRRRCTDCGAERAGRVELSGARGH